MLRARVHTKKARHKRSVGLSRVKFNAHSGGLDVDGAFFLCVCFAKPVSLKGTAEGPSGERRAAGTKGETHARRAAAQKQRPLRRTQFTRARAPETLPSRRLWALGSGLWARTLATQLRATQSQADIKVRCLFETQPSRQRGPGAGTGSSRAVKRGGLLAWSLL